MTTRPHYGPFSVKFCLSVFFLLSFVCLCVYFQITIYILRRDSYSNRPSRSWTPQWPSFYYSWSICVFIFLFFCLCVYFKITIYRIKRDSNSNSPSRPPQRTRFCYFLSLCVFLFLFFCLCVYLLFSVFLSQSLF